MDLDQIPIEPDKIGPYGRAWRVDIENIRRELNVSSEHPAIVVWLIEAPCAPALAQLLHHALSFAAIGRCRADLALPGRRTKSMSTRWIQSAARTSDHIVRPEPVVARQFHGPVPRAFGRDGAKPCRRGH